MTDIRVHVRHHFGSDPDALRKGIETLIKLSDRARLTVKTSQNPRDGPAVPTAQVDDALVGTASSAS